MKIMNLLKSKSGPIGLDIGHNSIRMIQLAQTKAGIKVIAAEEEAFIAEGQSDEQTRHDYIICAIKDMLTRGGFQGRNVVSCLSNGELKIKSFRLAPVEESALEETINKEASERFGLDPENDEIRHILAGNAFNGDDIKREVILFAAKRKTVEQHISLLEEAGLIPVSIDSVPCALLRSIKQTMRRQADQDVTRFFVDVGSEYTTVIIGNTEGISFIKQIPIAGRQLNEAVASKLDIGINEAILLRNKLQNDDSDSVNKSTRQAVVDAMRQVNEDIAREVSLCFRYHAVTFRGKSPDEILLAGGESYESTLIDTLHRHLGVEIVLARPLRGYELGKGELSGKEDGSLSEWSVATGASIKGWDMLNYGGQQHERN